MKKSCKSFFLFLLIANCGLTMVFGQQTVVVPSAGKEFWLGFLESCTICTDPKRLDVFVTSSVNTSGTLTIPGQSYTQNFTVIANQTTTVNIPNTTIAQHLSTETIDNKGIHIEALDTVSVYAINFQDYTSDGTLVLPIGSLGTDYMVTSYEGLSGYALYSNAVIVATTNGTQIEIIPSVNTLGGKTAGTSYIINLDSGQSYQLKAATSGTDLTGTIIRSTGQNGPCRPFAVFSGSMCSNIPVGCTACDHIYEQEYPTNIWGNDYMIVPFSVATGYTYKVLANTNGTTVTINGGSPQNLNAGQFYESNNVAGPVLIESNNTVSVAQFMQGAACSGDGDPAQLFINPNNQFLKEITFSTVASTVITQHIVNVIMKTAHISQLTLDSIPVNPSDFLLFAPDTNYSYAQLTLSQGSHVLKADSGFTAYMYGIGGYESYAYGLGAFRKVTIIPTDTVYCSDTVITLTPPEVLNFPQWYLESNPDSVISTSQSITVTPDNEVYSVTGFTQSSGCPVTYNFSVEIPTPPTLVITQSADTICRFDNVQLNANISPYSPNYLYNWTPSTGLSNASVPAPIASPFLSTWFHCTVSTPSGCASKTDSVLITVLPGNISNTQLIADKTSFCTGDSTALNLSYESFIFQDSVNPNFDVALWSTIGSADTTTSGCGSVSGKALYFNGSGNRYAATISLNVLNGGTVYFALKIANGTAPCEDADAGEDVVLEYSTDGGINWIIFATYAENQYPLFTSLNIGIPMAAQTSNTRFRWRQLSNSGINQDNWSIDNIFISATGGSQFPFSWFPATGLSDSTIANPVASPDSFIVYHTIVTDTSTGCQYHDSIEIHVGPLFSILAQDSITNCNTQGIEISATPSLAGSYSYNWSPSATLSNSAISNPISNATSTTEYFVTVISGSGCTVQDSITLIVPAVLSFFATPSSDTICLGEQVQLNTVFQKDCGVNGSVCSGTPVSIQVGTSTTVSSASSITIYKSTSNSARIQMLYTKQELNTAGITSAATLTSAGFNIQAVTGSNIYQNFTIKMECTSLTAFDNNFIPGLPTVFTPKNVILTSGLNYYNFNNNFDWDGNSNILVEICFNNSVTSVNSSVYYSNTTNNSVLYTTGVSMCSAASGTTGNNRANTYFKYCLANAGNIDLQWSPPVGLSSDTIPNPSAMPSSSIMYYVFGSDTTTGCNFSDSVFIQVDSDMVLNLGNDTSICSGQSVVMNAGSGLNSYLWNDGTTDSIKTISSDGIYWVEALNECGIKRDSVEVEIFEYAISLPPDTIICNGSQIELNVFDSAFISYIWDNGSTDSSIIISTNGLHWVSVTHQCGTSSDSILVTFHDSVQVNLGNDTSFCTGNSLTLDGGNNFTSFLWQDSSTSQTFNVINSGTYSITATNACGNFFDSITIILNQSAVSNQQSAICSGDSILLQGIYQTTSATYYDTLQTVNGCDSVIVTALTVNQSQVVNQQSAICNGDSVFVGGNYQMTAGSYYDTLQTVNGCDSIVETNLTVNSVFSNQYSVSICNGDSIFLQENYQTTAGTYYDTLSTWNGCDSIIETTLSVNQSAVNSQQLAICSGDSILLQGIYQTTSGTYYDTLSTVNGCDSIIETTLSINQSAISSQQLAICDGDSVFLEGNYQTTSGTYYDTLPTVNGCDSIIEKTLSINQTSNQSNNQTICNSDNIFLQGNYQTSSGIYYDTLSSVNGCDSIIETTLSVNQPAVSNLQFAICSGDSILLQGSFQGNAGTYYDTLLTMNSCDSILVTTLSVNSNPSITLSSSPDSTGNPNCSGTATANISGGIIPYSYLWSDGQTSQTATGLCAGNYLITVTDSNGCEERDSVLISSTVGIQSQISNLTSHVSIYPNPTTGIFSIYLYTQYLILNSQIYIYNVLGEIVYQSKITKSKSEIDLKRNGSGVYYVQVISENGAITNKVVVEYE